jgi:outer membrane lipoprotein-sorting protein
MVLRNILAVVLLFTIMTAVQAAVRPNEAQGRQILERLERAVGRVTDFQAVTDVNMRGADSDSSPLTFRLRVKARLPDKVRMDVLQSSFPLFKGWSFARDGTRVWMTDPVSERTSATDVKRLTGREPIRLDVGMSAMGALLNPSQHKVLGITSVKIDGVPAYRLRLGVATNRHWTVPLGSLLLWVDAKRTVPLRQDALATDGKLLFSTQFSAFKEVSPGLWVPGRAVLTHQGHPGLGLDEGPGRHTVILMLERVNGFLVPVRITTEGPAGRTEIRHSQVKINSGLQDKEFRLS